VCVAAAISMAAENSPCRGFRYPWTNKRPGGGGGFSTALPYDILLNVRRCVVAAKATGTMYFAQGSLDEQ
jgi:hypothetical protein